MLSRITTSIQLLLVFLHLVNAAHTNTFVPNTYVIEFDRSIHSFASKRHVYSKRSLFYEQLNANNINYDIRYEYEVINAVSMAFKTTEDATLFFEKAKGVKKAWPVNTVSTPSVYQTKVQDDSHVSSLFGLYNATGVTRVRDELGITGNGIKVGVIDTGVDYTHPALGGCFGPDCRVAYGYDFVGDAYTGENLPIPDDDPRDTCNGHGTHVTGIIGAKDTKLHFTGIAPDVTFGAYRIFGCTGSSSDDIIMKAMEKAYLDGMDVVNLSLGDAGWPESPASLLADELALRGMIVCAAAGNEGDKGIFAVGAPSLGRHALSIASVDNTHVLSHTFKIGPHIMGYTTSSGDIFNITSAEIIPASKEFLAENDACNPLQLDAKGKALLVNRGGCMFSQKVINAQNAGAIAVLIYNNSPGPVTPSIPEGMVDIDYGGISKDDGYKLFYYLASHPDDNEAEFLKEDVSLPVPTAGFISSFSSWGLGPDLSLKPDISAPGGEIYSTYPVELGSYATLSGTSMASPYAAGVVALLQQTRGGNRAINVKEIRSMLINNGHPFTIFGSQELESVARQGSGLIDVYRAVKSDTSVVPEQIRLNDIEHGAINNEYTFTVRNNGRLASEYTISHLVASTAQGFEHTTAYENLYPLQKPIILKNHEVEAVVEILDPVVLVQANEQVNVTVRIAPPVNAADIPPSIYSGFILVTKSHEREDVKYIPYAGLTANLNDLPVLIVNETMPYITGQVSALAPAVLSLQLAEASPLLKIKAVNSVDTTQELGFIPGGYAQYVGRNNIEDPMDVMIFPWFGLVVSTEEEASIKPFLRRDHQNTTPQQEGIMGALNTTINLQFAQVGTKLQKGVYKLKVMALRPFGDINNEQDYDIWYSPDIVVD